jgi:hypothetical protein
VIREPPPLVCGGRLGHADLVEPIFLAALANESAEIAAIAAGTPGAVAQRMDRDVLVAGLHWLYRGDTPVHLAAAGLRFDAVRALLAAGGPVDAVNRRGATALQYACDPRPSSTVWDPAAQRQVIELLTAHGAAVDQPDRGGVTALHRAVRARSPVAVGALLAAGADPRAATRKSGSTPLHLGVAPTGAGGTAGTGGQQLEIVRLLRTAGAAMTDTDRFGVTVTDRIRSPQLRAALAGDSPGVVTRRLQ